MKVYIVFKDGKPFDMHPNTNSAWRKDFINWLETTRPDHKWKIKKCELKVI